MNTIYHVTVKKGGKLNEKENDMCTSAKYCIIAWSN